MNIDDFNKVVDETVAATAALLKVKGGEYANHSDRLANFKRGSGLVGVTALQVALVYMSKHYDAVCSYVRHDSAGEKLELSEPIYGRFDDLINYCILMKALIKESEDGTESKDLP